MAHHTSGADHHSGMPASKNTAPIRFATDRRWHDVVEPFTGATAPRSIAVAIEWSDQNSIATSLRHDEQQAMVDFDADFNVWTRDKSDENSWSLVLNTSDMREAVSLGKRVGKGQTIALVYEQALFHHHGKRIVGQVAFWWSRNYYKTMGSSPAGRGSGYSDAHGEFVEYEFPGDAEPEPEPASNGAMVVAAGSELAEPEAVAVYADAQCDRCYKIVPGNQVQSYSSEVQTGRVSGTSRIGRSNSTRFSGRSFSSTSSHSESSSSGRTYYRTVTETLCLECYAQQEEKDRYTRIMYVVGAFLCLIILGIIYVVGSAHSHG